MIAEGFGASAQQNAVAAKRMRTAGELADALVAHVEQLDILERLVDGRLEGLAGKALEAGVEEEVLARRQRLPQQVVLRAHAHLLIHRVHVRADVLARDERLAARRLEEANHLRTTRIAPHSA